MTKLKLRFEILSRLRVLKPDIFTQAGFKLAEYLRPHSEEPIAIFRSFSDEIDTKLVVSHFPHVLLPDKDPYVYAQNILDAGVKYVYVPGLAFDDKCHRLGRGKGYYDRVISLLRQTAHCPQLIGLCLKFQLVASVPTEAHDQSVDKVISF
ncbi:MAG: 5-formyltetrahydrofolate cyclo-ligase [Myxococcota bacterium]